MFGECHAHIFLNGRNYKEAVALHKNHVSEEAIRQLRHRSFMSLE